VNKTILASNDDENQSIRMKKFVKCRTEK